MRSPKIAFALYGFNRPQYLQQVIATIDCTECREDIDFYYFQDGAINVNSRHRWCSDEVIRDNIAIVRGAETDITVVQSEYNYGAGVQQMRSTELLFDREKYDVIIGSVEDHLLSKHFFRIRKVLINQFWEDPAVFCVLNSWVNFMDSVKKYKAIDKYVRCLNTTSPGWTLFRDRWPEVKAKYMPYYNILKSMDYHTRDHGRIHRTFKIQATGHDGGLEWALAQTPMCCILPVMNRVQDIGMYGLHKRPQYNREHIERVTLHEPDAEREVKRFHEDPSWFHDLEFNPGLLRRWVSRYA